MREAEMNMSDVNRTTNFNLECRSATYGPRGVRRALTIVLARARLLLFMLAAGGVGHPASASPPDAPTRWSIVPSPNKEGANWLAAVDASAGNDAWAVGDYIGDEGVDET